MQYQYNKPTPLRPDVGASLRVSKDRPKATTALGNNYQGLEHFDATSYANQHRHGSHKRCLQTLVAPVVEVRTEKVSEYVQAPVVNGISLSPEQLINYQRGEL